MSIAACGTGSGRGFCPTRRACSTISTRWPTLGFEWNSYPGAKPRPTTPELRLADLDRDGIDKEFIYGCLMVNDLIDDAEIRNWVNARYNDWAADFAKRSDPNRVFPLAIIPNTDPKAAAAEVRRCAKMGLKGGDLHFKRVSPPLYHPDWFAVWEASAECKFPISFHSTGFKGVRAPDNPEMEKEVFTQWRLVRSTLFQLDTMEVLASLLASGACEKYPDFNFVLAEFRRDLAARTCSTAATPNTRTGRAASASR